MDIPVFHVCCKAYKNIKNIGSRAVFSWQMPYICKHIINTPVRLMDEKLKALERLLIIMDELREQCPWDKKQTMESLRHLTIEETSELADAILDKDMNGIKKELGDVLLHIVFYARIGSETN